MYAEKQNFGFFQQAQGGIPVAQTCRQRRFSGALFTLWRAKFGGMDSTDAGRLRKLEAESGKLKHVLAEAHLDRHARNPDSLLEEDLVDEDRGDRACAKAVGLSAQSPLSRNAVGGTW